MGNRNLTHYDPMGLCVYDYWKGDEAAELIVHSNVEEITLIKGSYLFRNYEEMPELEKLALQLSYGKVLDVGACSGCHSIILQEKGLDVLAVDISEPAVKTMKERGINTIKKDIFELNDIGFDTILLLMNGLGLGGAPEKTTELLSHLKTLLNPGGKIVGDSADLIDLYREEDGSVLLELTGNYYGEVQYMLEYKGIKGNLFDWLFIDYNLLDECAKAAGLTCSLVAEGNTDNYLAVIEAI